MRLGDALPWTCLAAAIALAWPLYTTLSTLPPASNAEAPLQDIIPLPDATFYEVEPRAEFTAVVDRPLFSPTRRPPAPVIVEAEPEPESEPEPEEPPQREAPPPPPPPAELALELRGIVSFGPRRVAVLKDQKDDALLRLKVDDLWRGWRLAHIGAQSVTFASEREQRELMLDYRDHD